MNLNLESLDNVLEALLFVSGDGLKISDICETLELQKKEIDSAIKRLKQKYSGKCGIHLIIYNGKVQFGSNPEYGEALTHILNPIREKALSAAALETVAIVAYRQPVTRLEVEKIRGVASDYAMGVLLSSNLVEVVGRKDSPGKPLLFGTTDEFLKRFRIESINELPDYDRLLESIKLISAEESAAESAPESESLYNEFVISDEDKPDFLEGENAVLVE